MTVPTAPDVDATSPTPVRLRSPTVAVAAALLVGLTLFAFSPTLDNDFVNWDDEANFLNNVGFRGLGIEQVRWAWTTFHMGTYQPIAWMLASVEYTLFGLDPRGFHAVSIAIHVFTIVLLFALTLAILRRAGVRMDRGAVTLAAVATGWFAVHPLRVEVVAWATSQAYQLCGLFFVAAILAYLRASDDPERRRPRWLNLSAFLFLASLLCKAPSVGLPIVLLVLDVYPLRRIRGGPALRQTIVSALNEKIWFFVLAAGFAVAAFTSKAQTFVGVVRQTDVLSRFTAAAYSGWFYLAKMIAPSGLVVYYKLPDPLEWRRTLFVMALISATAVCGGLLYWRTRVPALVAVVAAFLALLAPVSGFVSISTQLVADRHTYLVSMPWVLAIAGALLWCRRRGDRPVITATLAALAIAGLAELTMVTRDLNRSWRNSETLWTHALARDAGRTMMAYNNLAVVYLDRDDIDPAIALLRTALATPVDPSDVNGRLLVHSNLAALMERRRQFNDAAAEFEAMARLAPVSANVHYRWASALAAQGRLDEAIEHYTEALRLDPDHLLARPALDALRRRRGDS